MHLENIIYIILAIIGLSLLIFIHELGHYFIARREGMKVETFSIGFGKPLYAWRRNGVKWQIGYLPFGGYVKIAGMEKEGNKEPYEIPEGFYSKKPWARIKVALAGPIINILFAIFLFGIIWISGGREKPFSQFTKIIGWVDPHSELYQNGVRPGDEITIYNGKSYSGYKDLFYAAIMTEKPLHIEGNKINYFENTKTPFSYTLTPYHSSSLQKGFTTIGIFSPASYLIYNDFQKGRLNTIDSQYPIAQSGIQKKDQLIWANGGLIFSLEQLRSSINDGKVLLTIERNGKTFLGKVPRLFIDHLRLTNGISSELDDWRHEAGLPEKIESYYFIPYNLTPYLVVEHAVEFVDEESQITVVNRSYNDLLLQQGDRILAVDGTPVRTGYDFLKEIQQRRIQLIVKRDSKVEEISWKNEDEIFEKGTNWTDILPIISSLGTSHPLKENGNFHLLEPVIPIERYQFPLSPEKKEQIKKEYQSQLDAINKISNTEQRETALKEFHKYQKSLKLGIELQDQLVRYNPSPLTLFSDLFEEIWRTFAGLIGGNVSPKYLGGPVGIVQVMKYSWSVGVKEALFWLAAISLNLGILNLLPIPVLDGGHICFSILEAIRGKPLSSKTMQRLMIPFIALLIFFFLYVTYHDLLRVFGKFF